MTLNENVMTTMTMIGKAIEKGRLKILNRIFELVIQLLQMEYRESGLIK